VLLRLTYLGVTKALALLRLLPMSDSAKDAEILRHQITMLEPPHGAADPATPEPTSQPSTGTRNRPPQPPARSRNQTPEA
jgi:hypothetical protein